jgi:hypothetical protein
MAGSGTEGGDYKVFRVRCVLNRGVTIEAWCDFRFCAYLPLLLLVPRKYQLRAVISQSSWSADRTGFLEKPQANNRWRSMVAIFSDSW